MIFEYTEEELNHLKDLDENLAFYIDKIGKIEREINPNIFECLIYQIIGQQISNKAFTTIKDRVKNLLVEITPTSILAGKNEDIQKCGMSFKKVEYMKNIAKFWESDVLDFDNLHSLSNEELIDKLTQIKGVGPWTVEMLLIFSLQRKDVLSYNDLIIKNNLMKIHNINKMDKTTFNKYKNLYSPYGSIASLYLWELNNIQ